MTFGPFSLSLESPRKKFSTVLLAFPNWLKDQWLCAPFNGSLDLISFFLLLILVEIFAGRNIKGDLWGLWVLWWVEVRKEIKRKKGNSL